jgi:pyrroloquinoline-quinone synthase
VARSIWDRIESSRERWNVLRHPFYQRWSAGELTSEELARYSGQYRHAVEAIAAASESAASALPESAELAEHAREERDHVELWDAFVDAAGGSRQAPPSPETRECVTEWTAGDDAAAHLVRLYAIESGQPDISQTKREGLVELYGYADGPATEYFRVHAARDAEHAGQARRLIESIAAEADAEALVAAAEAAFRANWRLLDGV